MAVDQNFQYKSIHEELNQFFTYRNGYLIADGDRASKETKLDGFGKSLERLGGEHEARLQPTCMQSVVNLLIAQHNSRVKNFGEGVTTNQPVRFKNFLNLATCAFSLLARVIRIVIRTVFLIFSILLSAWQQSKYGSHMEEGKKHNMVLEDLRRYGYEWVDLAVSVAAVGISLVHTFAPEAISLDGIRNYYVDRCDDLGEKRATVRKARAAYNAARRQRQEAYRAAAQDAEQRANAAYNQAMGVQA